MMLISILKHNEFIAKKSPQLEFEFGSPYLSGADFFQSTILCVCVCVCVCVCERACVRERAYFCVFKAISYSFLKFKYKFLMS